VAALLSVRDDIGGHDPGHKNDLSFVHKTESKSLRLLKLFAAGRRSGWIVFEREGRPSLLVRHSDSLVPVVVPAIEKCHPELARSTCFSRCSCRACGGADSGSTGWQA